MDGRRRACLPEDPCGPNYVPLLTQFIPNQNKSHVHVDSYNQNCQRQHEMSGSNENETGKGICGGCYDVPTGHQRACDCQDCVSKRAAILEEDCPQHTEGNRWQDLGRKFRDPEVQAIHERMKSSAGAKGNLRWYPDDEENPCLLRRFRNSNTGYLGERRVHYGGAQDCDYPKDLIHGVVEYDITPAGKLISPPAKAWVDQLETDLAESIYNSNKMTPVGSSHNQLLNLPAHVHPHQTTFGVLTHKDDKVGDLVNPKKDRHFVAAESSCCHHMYRKTHGSYDPGEQICRNYEGGFRRSDTFGDMTPHDNAGRPCARAIGTWRKCNPDPPVVLKVYADHVDQRIPKLGMAQDRLCGLRDRGPNFVYGQVTTERPCPAGDVIFNRSRDEGVEKAKRLVRNLTDWVGKVRLNLKSDKGGELESLYEGFRSNDTNCNGTCDWESFMRCLIEERIPRTLEPMEFLESLAYVGIYHPSPCNVVDYNLLMDLIKGHKEPQFASKVTTLCPYYLPHTNSSTPFRTTYADLAANQCAQESCLLRAREERAHGMPSMRSDKVPQRIRSTRDTTNYGDDGDAYSLIWPSVYTVNGVTARDAFKVMTKEQMLKILCKARINVTHDQINAAWEEALTMDPDQKGRVCFQTFREALDKIQKEELDAQGLTYETPIRDCCPSPSSNCIPPPCNKRNTCCAGS